MIEAEADGDPNEKVVHSLDFIASVDKLSRPAKRKNQLEQLESRHPTQRQQHVACDIHCTAQLHRKTNATYRRHFDAPTVLEQTALVDRRRLLAFEQHVGLLDLDRHRLGQLERDELLVVRHRCVRLSIFFCGVRAYVYLYV